MPSQNINTGPLPTGHEWEEKLALRCAGISPTGVDVTLAPGDSNSHHGDTLNFGVNVHPQPSEEWLAAFREIVQETPRNFKIGIPAAGSSQLFVFGVEVDEGAIADAYSILEAIVSHTNLRYELHRGRRNHALSVLSRAGARIVADYRPAP